VLAVGIRHQVEDMPRCRCSGGLGSIGGVLSQANIFTSHCKEMRSAVHMMNSVRLKGMRGRGWASGNRPQTIGFSPKGVNCLTQGRWVGSQLSAYQHIDWGAHVCLIVWHRMCFSSTFRGHCAIFDCFLWHERVYVVSSCVVSCVLFVCFDDLQGRQLPCVEYNVGEDWRPCVI